jgi:predicted ArsR family transcriptional regulator
MSASAAAGPRDGAPATPRPGAAAVDPGATPLPATDTRGAVVELLAANASDASGSRESTPGLTAAQVGEALGLHVTTARFHLERLVAAGTLVTAHRRGGVGRPRKVYALAHDRGPGLAGGESLASFTELLTAAWSQARDGVPIGPEEAGRRWVADRTATGAPPLPAATTPGAWLGKVGLAVDLLDEWGYQPEVRTTDRGRTAVLTLHDCPFLTMARQHPDVVCGIHRGLVRGTLAAVGEADADVELEPFVTDRTCVARLTSAAVPGGPVDRRPRDGHAGT